MEIISKLNGINHVFVPHYFPVSLLDISYCSDMGREHLIPLTLFSIIV